MRLRDVVPPPQNPDWREQAACIGVDPGIFYTSEKSEAGGIRVCAHCPVRADCLSHAMLTPENFGTWGMVGESRRERLRRRLRRGSLTWKGLQAELDVVAADLLATGKSTTGRRRG